MDLELGGRVVLVTGGSKGIGLACARVFSQEGAQVAIASRNAANLEAARTDLAGDGIEVITVVADLLDPEDAVRMADKTETALGPIDILVNSAGAAQRHQVELMTVDDWHAGMNSKYFTYIYAIEAVIHRMADRGRGAVVNVIGAGGKQPTPTHLAGGTANAALMLATAGLAKAYASYGIRVNAVSPHFTLTGRMQNSIAAEAERSGVTPDEALERFVREAPLGRLARPEEIADVVVFLASERASYVSGSILMTDGAFTALVV